MVRVPTHRAPSHPGQMLLREFLEPLEITQTELAERMEIPFQRINSLVNGRRGITPDTALRLSKVFGTTPGFWMNHQLRWELFHAQRDAKDALKRIKPILRQDVSSTG
ncbi:MAG: HigA family addiction module antitoxin [Gemmatimonadota bacterium]|nr:HigA family addiction module antitoxin [Gemmatimonadota bacterium]